MNKRNNSVGQIWNIKIKTRCSFGKQKTLDFIWNVRLEHDALLANEKQILTQDLTYSKFDSVKKELTGNFIKSMFKNMKDY